MGCRDNVSRLLMLLIHKQFWQGKKCKCQMQRSLLFPMVSIIFYRPALHMTLSGVEIVEYLSSNMKELKEEHVTLACVPKITFCPCKLARKYKVTCNTRNTLAQNDVSTLRFGSPWPPRSVNPFIKVKSSKWAKMLSSQYFWKCSRKTGQLSRPFCFSSVFSKYW